MSTAKREVRRLAHSGLELRADKEKRTVGGYAILFNTPSQDLGGFTEIIAPDAFKRTLSDNSIDIISTVNHDQNQLIGRRSAGTLDLLVDDKGVRFEVKVPNTTAGNDLLELVSRGDIKGNSFEFRLGPGGDKWAKTTKGWQRTVIDADLYQVGPVVSPAYTETDLALRAQPPADEPSSTSDKEATQRQHEAAKRRLAIA